MKVLLKKLGDFALSGRWDIDFHLPAQGILVYPERILKRIDEVADISKAKRDPSKKPEEVFQYIDIASVDVSTGLITNPQELTGDEAPSRARKVVSAFDIAISTCRPTRGGIAVIPPELHNQIASTAFSIVRAKNGINPFYLFYAIRLSSTLEQFRKWSTGSSYPAILDEDVKKTRIPVPSREEQDNIAILVSRALLEHSEQIRAANEKLNAIYLGINDKISSLSPFEKQQPAGNASITIDEIKAKLLELGSIEADNIDTQELDLFDTEQ